MLDQPRVHHKRQMGLVPTGRHLQQHGLIEMVGLWQILLEEPVLDRCEGHWSCSLCLLPRWMGLPQRFCNRCKPGNGRVLEDLFGREVQALHACTCDDLHTENGVASQRKEVVMNAYLCPNS